MGGLLQPLPACCLVLPHATPGRTGGRFGGQGHLTMFKAYCYMWKMDRRTTSPGHCDGRKEGDHYCPSMPTAFLLPCWLLALYVNSISYRYLMPPACHLCLLLAPFPHLGRQEVTELHACAIKSSLYAVCSLPSHSPALLLLAYTPPCLPPAFS